MNTTTVSTPKRPWLCGLAALLALAPRLSVAGPPPCTNALSEFVGLLPAAAPAPGVIAITRGGSLALCEHGAITVCATNSGTPPFSFAWFKDGAVIADATNNCLALTNVAAADAAVYGVAVANPCSVATNWFTLVVTNNADTLPPVVVAAPNGNYQCLAEVPPPDVNSVIATDNSGLVTVTFLDRVINTKLCTTRVIDTYRAADSCGNTALCIRTNIVHDTTPPQLVGVPLNASYQCLSDVPPTPTVTALDNCDPNIGVIVTTSFTGNCPLLIDIRWTASDRCGNTATTNQIITVHDTLPPVISTGGDLAVECGSPWSFTPPPTMDNCDGTNVALSVVGTVTNRLCGNTYSVTRSYAAIDECGNLGRGSQTITIVDATAPALTCAANRTVEGGAAWTFDAPAASDLCDGTNVTINVVSTTTNFTCGDAFTATRVWEALDACANRSTCRQTVTVADTTPPDLTCAANKSVECGAAWDFDPPATVDQFQGTNVTLRIVGTVTNTAGFCGNTFSATRTWEATDSCSNSARCSQTVSVVDTTPPVLACAGSKTVECGLSWNFDPPTAHDACGGTNVTLVVVSTTTNFTCGKSLVAERTWRATDQCENSATCRQTVSVLDTTPPTLACAPDRAVECGLSWEFTRPTAFDLCDGTNVTLTVLGTTTNRLCGPTFVATRTWRATDQCQNGATCSQTITVVDTTPPALACAPDQAVEWDTPLAFTSPLAFDNCGGFNVTVTVVSTVTNLICGNTFIATRTWEAADPCDNKARCSQTLTFQDTTPPALTCGADQTVECGDLWTFSPPIARDLCDGTNVTVRVISTETNRTCGNAFVATRIWEAFDACRNAARCRQVVTVVDTTPPVLACGANQTFACGAQWVFDLPTADDLCDGAHVTVRLIGTETNRTCGPGFVATRVWEAVDSCNNTARCAQVMTVTDTAPPAIACAPDRTVECGADWAFADPTATDSCDGANLAIHVVGTLTNTAGFCGKTFSATRTWEASDSCSNRARCSQTITVVDTTPPGLACAANKTVECGTLWTFDAPTANDLCDGTEVTVRIVGISTNFTCGRAFTATRTWEAVDHCTNRSVCRQTVAVVDTTPPVLAGVPPDAAYQCWGDVPPLPEVTASDNCDGANLPVTPASSITTNDCGWTISRRWTATDSCSNITTATQEITVRDTVAPTLVCAADKTVECGTAWSFDAPSLTDNCDPNPALVIAGTVTNRAGFCGNTYSVTRAWEASDSCANVARCAQTITLVDTAPPEITCAHDRTVNFGAAWSFDAPAASDLCDGANVTVQVVGTVTNATCGQLFAATRTWEVADQCGNQARCRQTVTVVDSVPPAIACVGPKTVECGLSWAFDAPSCKDKCDGTNLTLVIVSTTTNFICGQSFAAVRTWRVTDQCTNSATCSQTVNVIDTTPPTLACAPDKSVERGLSWAFTRPTAFDLCDGTNVTITVLRTTTNQTCGQTITATRTWQVTDSCTNRATCSQTITEVDTTPPTVVCAPDLTVECGTPAGFTAPTAFDSSDGTNITLTVVSTETNRLCGRTYRATRTWEAADHCGNRAQCRQTLTFVDTLPPALNCSADHVVECGASWSFKSPAAFDLCDGTNVAVSVVRTTTNAACGQTFSATRVWEAVDACGNAATCRQTVTVVDTRPPRLVCGSAKFVDCAAQWTFDPPSAFDDCDGASVSLVVVGTVTNRDGFCGNTFSATRTWRATDACTNSATCSQTVLALDMAPPLITCGPDQTVECGTAWAFVTPKAEDLFDGTNVTVTIVSTETNTAGHCGRTFSVTRMWEAMDQCGDGTRCSQTITVVDTTPPDITCGADQVVECGTTWSFAAPRATDTCDGTNLTLRIISTVTNTVGHCGKSFDATRTWEAADQCGNSARCSQKITVQDTTAPEITCGKDQTVECGTAWAFAMPNATDICDGTNLTIRIISTATNTVGHCGKSFDATRTWEAADQCGNSARCRQTITVQDTTAPEITCGKDQTVECGTAWAFAMPNATDICDGTNLTIRIISTVTNTVGHCGKSFDATRTWEAADQCGNSARCRQTITVQDTTAPEITCGKDQTVECGTAWAFAMPNAHDSCDGTNLTLRIVSTVTNTVGHCGKSFDATRTWEAADQCGNSARCSQKITVQDTTAPEITCGKDQTVECGTAWAFAMPNATDICDGTNLTIRIISTATNTVGHCGKSFDATRTWEAADQCGNSARCSQKITVQDTTAPDITCGKDQTVECGTAWAFAMPNAHDTCDGTNLTLTVLSTTTNATCGKTFSATRTWRATDQCGNSSTCRQTITEVDTTPPQITCGSARTVECGVAWAFDRPSASDTCDGANVTVEVVSTTTNATCGKSFAAVRTWQATDQCGNAATCSQTVNVVDTTPPSLVCAPDHEVECGVAWAFTPPTAFDLCDGTNLTVTVVSTITNRACGKTIAVTRTWQATDSCANGASCHQTITEKDTTPPTLVCAPDLTVECGTPAGFTAPSASDNCDGTNVTLTVVSTVTNAACGLTFTATRTWEAADQCANKSRCRQTITFVDTAPPDLACGANKTVECGVAWNFDPPTARDLCDGTNVTVRVVSTETNRACGLTFVATRIWEAFDACHNTSKCSQVVTVVDTTPPQIACAETKTVECGSLWSFDRPAATDNCDGTNVTLIVVSTTTNAACGQGFTAVRTWRATDQCQNAATCHQTVNVADTTPPTVTCAPDRVVECGLAWSFTLPTAFDSCDGTNVTLTVLSTTTNRACGRTISATRTWKVTDACTNSATCSQTITEVDTTPPSLACAPDLTVECGTPADFTAPAALDTCDGTNVAVRVVGTVTNALCGGSFSATRTWEAVDQCTNGTTCRQTITFTDTTPPQLECRANKRVECGAAWNFDRPAANDLCDGTNVTVTVVGTVTNFTCGRTFTATRTWRATDRCTNSSTCRQTVTVADTTAPTLNGVPAHRSVACLGDVPAPAAVTASDECDANPLVTLTAVTNGPCPTIITRTWTAADACSNSASAVQIITVLEAPPVLAGPTNATVCAGGDVTFCVSAQSSCPVTYQWLRNATPIPGATNACLAVTNANANRAGDYCVRVSSPCHVVSACATLRLLNNTTAEGPDNRAACPGENVLLCAMASGTGPFSYAWFKGGAPIDGATGRCLALSNVTTASAGQYAVKVSGACNAVTNSATVTVLTNVTATPLNDQLVCIGGTAQFCTEASGTGPFRYAWFKDGALLDGATSRCLTLSNLTAASGGQYSVKVSGACNSVTNFANLTLLTNTTASALQDQLACGGDAAQFCTAAAGTGPFSYTWYHNGASLPDATSNCLTVANVSANDAGLYCVVVRGACNAVTNCARLKVCAALGDFVWHDLNHNDAQDAGEPGLPNVPVKLLDAGGSVLAVTNTDATGFYLFAGLAPGDYRVMFTGPATYQFCAPRVGSDAAKDSDPDPLTGMTLSYTLADGETNRTVDAGLFTLAAIGDRVWHDANTNGVQDLDEPGLANVLVKLTDCNGSVLATTNTDANGFYLFADLVPGHYAVMFAAPAGHVFARPDAGGDDAADSDVDPSTGMTVCHTLGSGEVNRTVDAGLVKLGVIGDLVWHDLNYNGVQDAGEPGVANAVVSLLDCANNVLATANTSGDGRYQFSGLLPGQYQITFTAPAGFNVTTPDAGSDDANDSDANATTGLTACFPLAAGQTNLTVDAGLFKTAALGDFVWHDANTNGVQDAGEPGVSNVTVKLIDCHGAVLATTATDANGRYLFSDLQPGGYRVQFVAPANTMFAAANLSDDALDSDANPADGLTACVTLVSGESNRTVDAGLVTLPTPCAPATFVLEGSSALSGSAGNVRTFSAGGVSVKATAFSRTTNGSWAAAYLGSYSGGLGVTDSSEGDGGNDRHTVDNLDRFNYVLFEFSQPVVVNRAYLGYVVSDSDLSVWIGTAADPYNNHLTLSDAMLGGLAFTEDSLASNASPRWAGFNAGGVSGNVLVIAALKNDAARNDQFKIAKLDVCAPVAPCAPALAVTVECSNAPLPGQPITFGGTVRNTGNSVVTNIGVTHTLAGQVALLGSLGPNASATFSGSFTPPACGSNFTTTVTASGRAACNNSAVSATASSTCSAPCPPSCPPATFILSGSSAVSGAAGNVRTFSAGGVSVKATAFSRTTNGVWAAAYLGSYGGGLGVTDTSEGDGSNNRHTVDNLDRLNYVLFEFSQPVIVSQAYLDSVTSDSDLTVWIGAAADPFNNHLTLSDALLNGLALREENLTDGATARWAGFNGFGVPGNVLVLAAWTGDTTPEDQFKISKLDVCTPTQLPSSAALGDRVWHDLNGNGLQDAGEPGASGVSVRLQSCSGTPLATATTDTNGQYLFANLAAGSYQVTFVAPAGSAFTVANAGTNGGLDSDANSASGATACVTLVAAQTNRMVDAGLVANSARLAVVKEVACCLPDNACGAFGKTATAYKSGSQAPAFCYAITISNSGPTSLTRLSCLDDQLGDLTANFFDNAAAVFPPGASLTRYFKMSWDVDTTNTITVTGASVLNNQMARATDSALAFVDTAGVVCQTVVTSADDRDGLPYDSHVQLPQDGATHQVRFTTIVCNNGDADLAGVTVSSPALAALGCAAPAPFRLAAGACYTNICTTSLLCSQLPLAATHLVTAVVDTVSNPCGYDLSGAPVAASSQCEARVDCAPPTPCVGLSKRANRTSAPIGGPVTYTYTVTNCGGVTLTSVLVTDDNGTPDLPGDDFTVGTVPSLAPGGSVVLTNTAFLPVALCGPNSAGEITEAGTLIKQVLPDGHIKAIFVQSFNRNDNTYGANDLDWQRKKGHKFNDLTHSDHAEFSFADKSGQVVLKFMQDYCSESRAFPSGYGCLGLDGDGGLVTGNPAHLLDVSSSLEENLNKQPFLGQLSQYTKDSPALDDPNSPFWEYRMIYTCIVSKNAFGTSGFGDVAITDQHNSPPKDGPKSFMPVPCDSCVTNLATVTAKAGSVAVTNSAAASVCATNRP